MPDLTGPGVRVLLIGTARYASTRLPDLPSVRTSLDALALGLREFCGVDESSLRVVPDPEDAATMIAEISRAAIEAETVLLVYYLGHGLVGKDDELLLTATGTEPMSEVAPALPYARIAEAVGDSAAWNRLVVLDCCYSGRAGLWPSRLPPERAAGGSSVIASAESFALAPGDADRTLFTGAFLELLEHGDPHCGGRITVAEAYESLRRRLRERHGPTPLRQVTDTSGDLVLAPNRAPQPTSPDSPDSRKALPDKDEQWTAGRIPYPGLQPFTEADGDVFHGREQLTGRLVEAVATAAAAGSPLIVLGAPGVGTTSLLRAGLIPALPDHEARYRVPDQLGDADLAESSTGAVVLVIDQLEAVFGWAPARIEAFVALVFTLARRPGTAVVLGLRSDHYARVAHHPDLVDALNRYRFDVPALTDAQVRAAIEGPAAVAGVRLEPELVEALLRDLRGVPGSLPLLAHALRRLWTGPEPLTVAGYDAIGRITGAVAPCLDAVLAGLTPEEALEAQQLLPRLIRTEDDRPETAYPLEVESRTADRVLAVFAGAGLVTVTDTPARRTARIRYDVLIRAWPRLSTWLTQDRDWLSTRRQMERDARAWAGSGQDPSMLYRGRRLDGVRTAVQEHGGARHLDAGTADFYRHSRFAQHRADRRRGRWLLALVAAVVMVTVTGLMAYGAQRNTNEQRAIVTAQLLTGEADQLRAAEPGLSRQLALVAYRTHRETGAPAVLSAQAQPAVYDQGEHTVDVAVSTDGRVLVVAAENGLRLWSTRGGRLGQVNGVSVGALAVGSSRQFVAAATGPASTAGGRQRLTLWTVADPRHPRQLAEIPTAHGELRSLVTSPDERRLATGSADGHLTVWDVSDPARPRPLSVTRVAGGALVSLAFAPDGRSLFGSTAAGTTMWDVSAPDHVVVRSTLKTSTTPPLPGWPGQASPVRQRLAIDRTGRYLAAPGDGENLRVWDLKADPGRPRLLPTDRFVGGDCSSIDALAWVDGALVVSCGADPISYAFQPKAGAAYLLERRGKLTSGRSATAGGPLAVREEGGRRFLLNAGGSGVVSWPVQNLWQPGALLTLPARSGLLPVQLSRARSPAGEELLADSAFYGYHRLTNLNRSTVLGSYRIFSGATGQQRLEEMSAVVAGPALSPDGRVLATEEAVGSTARVALRLTATPDADPVARLTDPENGVHDLRFSADNTLLAVVDNRDWPGQAVRPSSVKLYDVHDPRRPRLLSTTPAAKASSVAFSPDRRLMAVFGADALMSWDISDPARPVPRPARALPVDTGYTGGEFSADGTTLLQSGRQKVWLWPVTDHQVGPTPVGLSRPDWSADAAFSPDGRTLAVTQLGEGNALQVDLWNVDDPRNPQHRGGWSYTAGGGGDTPVSFTSNGRSLVVGSGEGVSLWSMDPVLISGLLCANVGDRISRAEWATYVPDHLPYDPPC